MSGLFETGGALGPMADGAKYATALTDATKPTFLDTLKAAGSVAGSGASLVQSLSSRQPQVEQPSGLGGAVPQPQPITNLAIPTLSTGRAAPSIPKPVLTTPTPLIEILQSLYGRQQ